MQERIRYVIGLLTDACEHHQREYGFTDPTQASRLKAALGAAREIRTQAPETPADARTMAAEQRRRASVQVRNEE